MFLSIQSPKLLSRHIRTKCTDVRYVLLLSVVPSGDTSSPPPFQCNMTPGQVWIHRKQDNAGFRFEILLLDPESVFSTVSLWMAPNGE